MVVATLIALGGLIFGSLGCDDGKDGDTGSAHELCGNGVVEEGEECDGSALGGHRCQDFGYTGGQISCTAACTLTFGSCEGSLDTCGNGTVEPGEECDDGNDTDCDGCNACRISEFRVNATSEGDQQVPQVAMTPDGRFVVVWVEFNQDGEGGAIYGQIYGADGTPVGGEFQINATTRFIQDNPDVAMAPDGHFVVVWESGDEEGTWEDVYGRIFDSNGNPADVDFMVNTTTVEDQMYPSIAMDDDGNFVVVWQSYQDDTNTYGVFGQRYDAQGNRVGEEFQLDTNLLSAWFPKVVMAPDGRFIAVWQNDSEDGSGKGIYGKIYDRDGNPVAEDYLVMPDSKDEDIYFSVAIGTDGSFVLIWNLTEGYDKVIAIRGQRFNADGTRNGSEFTVAVPPEWERQSASGVAMDSSGSFVVAYYRKVMDGGMEGGDVYVQRFSADNMRDGNELHVNTCSGGRQAAGPVAMAPDGRFVIVRTRDVIDDGGWDIFAQRYTPDGIPMGLSPMP